MPDLRCVVDTNLISALLFEGRFDLRAAGDREDGLSARAALRLRLARAGFRTS